MTERYKYDRNKYKSLYCTREQGDKILEITGIYPMNFWVDDEEDDRVHGFMESVYDFEYVEDSVRYKYKVHPAYTLQELRDVAEPILSLDDMYHIHTMMKWATTSELADLLIEQLEKSCEAPKG